MDMNPARQKSAPPINPSTNGHQAAMMALAEASPEGLIMFDHQLNLVASNRAGEALLGVSRDSANGNARKSLMELIPGIAETGRYAACLDVLTTGQTLTAGETITAAGKRLLSIRAFRVDQGLGMIVSDAAERDPAGAPLPQNEALFRTIFECTATGIALLNSAGVPIRINPALQRMLGYSLDELRGMAFTDYMHHDDATKDMPLFLEMAAGRRSHYQVEKRYIRKDRRMVWGRLTLSAVPRPSGEMEFAVAMVEDITEHKEAVRALEQSEGRFRSLIENALDVIVVIRNDGSIGYESPSVQRMLGYRVEDLLGQNGLQFVHPDDFAAASGAFGHLLQNPGSTYSVELRVRHVDGSWHTVQAMAHSLIHDPAVAGIVVNFRDVTEHKAAEEALAKYRRHLEKAVEERTIRLKDLDGQLQKEAIDRQQAEKELKIKDSAITSSINAIAIGDLQGNLTYVNNAFLSLWGYEDQSDIVGRPATQFLKLERKALLLLSALAEKQSWIGELIARRSDGAVFDVHISASIVRDAFDEPICFMASLLDITESKQAQAKLQGLYERERELRQQLEDEMRKRMEFTRALAHELKTPLTPVVMSGQILASQLTDQTHLRVARNICRGAANLNSRIDELLDLAKGEIGILQISPERLCLPDLLRDAAEEAAPIPASRGQYFTTALPEHDLADLPPVFADGARVKQIILNLLNNAFKFTPEGGRIALGAHSDGANVVIQVSDTGPGMGNEEQDSVFDPYHRVGSGKERLSGLGLGLALCRTLVELHGGRIWVQSAPGKGSTFSFSLPLPVAHSDGTPNPTAPGGRHGRELDGNEGTCPSVVREHQPPASAPEDFDMGGQT